MYRDRKNRSRRPVLLAAGLVLLALLLALVWRPSPELRGETEYAIEQAIERSALQCFTVEGVYPESLDYLTEHYGLRVNTKDYYVVYEVFADNLPPTVRVAKKQG